jgi:hypothetical protein
VGGTGVGGMAVGGTGEATTAVGGTASVTTTAVGGTDVLVGSADTTSPVVAVGSTGAELGMGGLPLAGNLQPVAMSANTTSSPQVRINFLFMIASLEPDTKFPMMIFYIIL